MRDPGIASFRTSSCSSPVWMEGGYPGDVPTGSFRMSDQLSRNGIGHDPGHDRDIRCRALDDPRRQSANHRDYIYLQVNGGRRGSASVRTAPFGPSTFDDVIPALDIPKVGDAFEGFKRVIGCGLCPGGPTT